MGVLDTARAKGVHRPHLRNNEKINKAASVVGHGKKADTYDAEAARSHRSAPLSTLQDPAAFGAPPRRHTAQSVASQSPSSSSPSSTVPPALPAHSKPPVASKPLPPGYATRGLGAALPKTAIDTYTGEAPKQQEEEANKPPPVPYRTNTTGLTTDSLPKPPVRRAETMEAQETTRSSRPYAPASRPTPQPPPRLPVRQNSHPDEYTPEPPPPYASPAQTEQLQHQPAAPTSMGQLSELQSRFAKLPGRVSSPPAQEPSAGSQGTTWQQKQAAAQTARQLHQDPSSVSASDAYSAAKTAQDFHQRHGEQIASGTQKAKTFDSKYGVSGKVGSFVQSQTQQQEPAPAPAAAPTQQPVAAAAAAKKPAPPPPPPKRRGLQEGATDQAPPPIPLSSKPK